MDNNDYNIWKNGDINMNKIITAILIAVLTLTTVFSAVSANTFIAEHIGSTSYNTADKTGAERWAVLVSAAWGTIHDAWDLNNTLVNHGWQADHIKVLSIHDASKENIINAIQWMNSKEDEDDIVLFFFSGHGGYKKIFAKDGENITSEELNCEFNNFESNSIVIIFNSCFSASMDELNQPGRVILMSCRRFEVSQAFPDANPFFNNGYFSFFLIKGFEGGIIINADKNQDGWISAEEAFKYAKPRTTLFALLHLGWQHPQIYDGYKGEFNIVPFSN